MRVYSILRSEYLSKKVVESGRMTITISEITDSEQWDAFLTSQPRGHLLQSYEWGELNKYLGGRIYRLGALDNGRMVGRNAGPGRTDSFAGKSTGALQLALLLRVARLVEKPDAPTLSALIEYAHSIARKEHAVVLRLEPNIADDDPDVDAWLARLSRPLVFTSIPSLFMAGAAGCSIFAPTREQLLADFKMTWRQNVRGAERKGVIIREAESDADFDAYYDLLKITSDRDAFFIHDKDYHREILRHFASKGDAVLYLAEHEGEAIAAKMLIRFGDWCWDMFGASSNNKRNLKPTYLLQYRCFQWAKAKGAATSISAPSPKYWSQAKRCGASTNTRKASAASPA